MSVPSSVIHIVSGVPINNSYEHTLWFPTKVQQTAYFLENTVKTYDRFTYLKPEKVIKVAGYVENARSWNYLMFQNDAGKWYYHFITKVVYLNDNAVELHLELDVIQTYMFDWELRPCFIERMHTETDEFGEHTIPEGLETGPLIQYNTQEIQLEDNYIIIMMSSTADGLNGYGRLYGGVFSGLTVYAVDPVAPGNIMSLNQWLDKASGEGFIDAIVAMWMYPKELVTVGDYFTGAYGDTVLKEVTGINDTSTKTITDPIKGTIDGYLVKNKKTLTYPYTMLYVTNNMGGCAVYHRERFENETDGEYKFTMLGAMSPDSGVQLTPHRYKGSSGYTFEEALTLPAFPSCAWASDTYLVWLAQNQHTLENAQSQALIQAGTGIIQSLTGNPFGGASSAYSALTSTQALMAQKADMAIQPDQARGQHSGNINLTHGHHGFSCHFMTITSEYAKAIDQYFTRYGYKVNKLATPNLHTRELFTYVKTVGSLVTGNLGTEDQLKIQAIFDKGLTFWADPSKVGSYFNPNNPL